MRIVIDIVIDIEDTEMDPEELVDQIDEALESLFEHNDLSAQVYLEEE